MSIATTSSAPLGANPLDLSARHGNAATLAQALVHSRRCTLALADAVQAALPTLTVPQRSELNPPLWELGHIGWFQDVWLGRFPQRALGAAADPNAPRHPAARPNADALYDSSHVPQASRWALPLPDASATRADLAAQLATTLALLAHIDDRGDSDSALYFFRLALVHEDMHHEAGLYMAHSLGLAIDDPAWQPKPLPAAPPPLAFDARSWLLGSTAGQGFAFDNELDAHVVALGPTVIDAQAVRWAEYLPFITSGGYADARCWSDAGHAWRLATGAAAPRDLRQQHGPAGNIWQQWRGGRWLPLDLTQAACHLSWFEADAWCRWAGRRLPSEAEWEHAACTQADRFRWGDVWEWTASAFAPYPGFTAHPYRDYSAPWFDGRPVLRGGSHLTQPRLKHPRYRNYFQPERNDVPAGFRSCAR